MGETAQILSLWNRARAGGDKVCLATVVHVEGSSYRKPGARMLVTSAGERAGTISGGCLEAEVSRKAWWLTRNGPALERYQSSFDEDGGGVPWGLGCGGTVWVLLEQEPLAVLTALKNSINTGEPSVIVSRLSSSTQPGEQASDTLGTTAVVANPGTRTPPQAVSPALPATLCSAVDTAFAGRRSLSIDANLNPTTNLPTYFVEYLAPPPHLTLYGAGDDAQPIAQFADALGWRLTVADGRSHLLRPNRFPTSTELRLLHYSETPSRNSPVTCGLNEATLPPSPAGAGTAFPENAAVTGTDTGTPPAETIPSVDPGISSIAGSALEFAVLLTHSYDQDRALLAALLPQPLDYLGILGPRHRTRRLIDEVAPVINWTPEACFARLHSPVGLDLGAADPASIALAIVAELQATAAGREVAVRRPPASQPSLPRELAQARVTL